MMYIIVLFLVVFVIMLSIKVYINNNNTPDNLIKKILYKNPEASYEWTTMQLRLVFGKCKVLLERENWYGDNQYKIYFGNDFCDSVKLDKNLDITKDMVLRRYFNRKKDFVLDRKKQEPKEIF